MLQCCTVQNISTIFKPQLIEHEISYIVQCKENYSAGIYPADPDAKRTIGYRRLAEIAKTYFDKNLYDDFALYFMEGQYLIQLWAAHLILEYGEPTQEIKNKCLDEIKKYAEGTILTKVAAQERRWLENYFKINF